MTITYGQILLRCCVCGYVNRGGWYVLGYIRMCRDCYDERRKTVTG